MNRRTDESRSEPSARVEPEVDAVERWLRAVDRIERWSTPLPFTDPLCVHTWMQVLGGPPTV